MDAIEERWGEASAMFDPHLLEGFEPRPSDVLICTASKAGTTWMQQILHQLRTGGDRDFVSINEVVPWLELPERARASVEAQLASYDAIPDPRVFKTHLPAERTPGAEVVKIVCVARSPLDCCVSHFHHLHGLTRELLDWLDYTPSADFDAYVAAWIERADWFEVVPSWWARREEPNVRWVRYADLRADPRAGVAQLAEAVGFGADAIEVAVELSSLDWMRAHEDRFTRLFREHPPSFEPRSFVRQGGGGRAELSPAQREAILERARAALPDDAARSFFDV
ncbi:MAG: sulfotransferase domain-containing protein [Sandaracinaceae bacterium]|nr:sulfotransferase domain-containing protein [Sandaracinaceae bacterium]